MRRKGIIGALWCAIFAAALVGQPYAFAEALIQPPQIYTLEVEAPEAGHFWAVGPLPIDAPPVLVGPHGARAYRLQTLGDHSAIYGFEGLGELTESLVPLAGAVDTDGVPLWWPHPAVMDDLGQLQGYVSIGGHEAQAIQWEHVEQGQFRQRFRSVHDCGPFVAVLWRDVFARSPVVHVSGFLAAKDRDTHRGVGVKIGFGEPMTFPTQRLHGGRLTLDAGAIRGAVDLDRGAIYPIRLSLLCAYDATPEVGPEPPKGLDELTAAAIAAGKVGQRWFVPTRWDAEWLGIRPALGTDLGRDLAARAAATWSLPHGMHDARPWASAPNANQGGAQNGLGASWWLPALVSIDHHPHDVHLWCAWDWGLRPVHFGVPFPVLDLPETTVGRQVYGVDHPIAYRTRGEIPVELGDGNVDWRTPHDEQHLADMPLCAAYALTGNPVVAWILDSHRAVDLAQRRPVAGWRNGPRGEGRTASSMLMAARLRGGDALAQVQEHLLGRLDTANRLSSTVALNASAPSRPLHLQNDPRIYCEKPASVPYEEATLAWSSWLLWQSTGERRPLDAAYRYGLAVAVTLSQVGEAWRVPYAVHQLPDGSALTEEQLNGDRYAHRSTWPVWWSGEGLRALVWAANVRGVDEGHEEFVARARQALAWLDAQPPPSIDQAHHALHGGRVPVAPIATEAR